MNRKIVLTGLAALMLAASAAPASAQARRGSDIYISGDYGGWYGDYGYYGPGVGVSVGFGAPAWGYDNWGYGAYAAAPCTCGTSYRSVRVAPRYRASTYAWGSYPYDYDYGYASSYPYDDYYYGGNYASVGFGWSDGRRFDGFSREDRVRIGNRETRFNDREIRGGREVVGDRGRMSRASVSGESRTTTGSGAEVRGGANSEFRSGTNPADFTFRSSEQSSGRSGGETRSGAGAEVRTGASGQTSGRAGRRGDNR